jgi:alcohol dehydrogenase, propanol-preferring
MRAVLLERPGAPLRLAEVAEPRPAAGQVLVRVSACAVCRTDLHLMDGELPDPKLPLILGHQIVGEVVETVPGEAGAPAPQVGQRVGIPWLGWTCGQCRYCGRGQENLCHQARFTGYTVDGGFAEYAVADARYAFPLPEGHDDTAAAPLLCAGLIGYRTLRLARESVPELRRLAIYGFGAAGHLVAQVAAAQGIEVFAFTRPGDEAAQAFARRLGATWAGPADEPPPQVLDAALIFAPAGELIPTALRAVDRGGAVVCGGIHMSDVPAFRYQILWHERLVRSVANLERRDGEELLALAPRIPLRVETREYPLEQAAAALDDLRAGRLEGAAVLRP